MNIAKLLEAFLRLFSRKPEPVPAFNAALFFAAVRKVTNRLDQTQVDVINAILAAMAGKPASWVAYVLATAWHEARFRPIGEIGKGRGKRYGKPNARLKAIPNPPDYGGQIPYGRGLSQLTWVENYEWADKALGLQGALLANFDLALEPDIAVKILVRGMEEGAFTGKSLADYLPDNEGRPQQFVNARRIVNGTDRASLIAGHAVAFQAGLIEGGWQ